MSARYDQAMARLHALSSRGVTLGLERVEQALASRGNPQRAGRFVHIAGTNGKGSVAAFTAAILKATGLRVGLYTSPHLHRFVERIRVDGRPIADSVLAARIEGLFATPDLPPLSFFEAATVVAFEHFATAGCDVTVLETGLGGRLDATNVVDPEVTVITNVAFDHERVLGDTLPQIATEKAGILDRGAPLVHGVRERSAAEVVRARAESLGVETWALDDEIRVESNGGRATVHVPGRSVRGLRSPLVGAHQLDNLALAVAACVRFTQGGAPVTDAALRTGVRGARWPGRLERIDGHPPVWLDGAHNPDGCARLAAHVANLPGRRKVLVFGAMVDKRLDVMLDVLAAEFDERFYAAVPLERACRPEQLAERSPGTVMPSVEAAVDRARVAAGPRGVVVVAGSLFVVAAARAHLLGLRSDPPIAM